MSDSALLSGRSLYLSVCLWLGSLLCISATVGNAHRAETLTQDSPDLPHACSQLAQSNDKGRELLQGLTSDGSASSYGELGQFYLEVGAADCAHRLFQDAIAKDPGLVNAHYGLGLALLQEGENQRSVDELRLVVQHAPEDAMAHNALGLGLEALGSYESAEQEFGTALRLDPQFDVACFNLAHVLGAQKKYPAVIFYLKKAMALAPKQPAYQLALGTAYVANGDYDAAIKILSELLSVTADAADAYSLIGDAYMKQGNPQMAAQNYQKSLQLDPHNDSVRLRWADALVTSGNDPEAVTSLTEYLRQRPEDFRGHYLLGRAYRELNQLPDARRALEQAVAINPDDYKARYELGFVLEHLGFAELASRQLQAATRLKPEESQAHHELSKVLRTLNDDARAGQEFQQYLKLEAKDRNKKIAAALHAQALTAIKQGDSGRGVNIYREAVKLDPSDPQLQYDFALALGSGGKTGEQQIELQRTIKLDPNMAVAHSRLALLYMNQGRTGEAKTEFKTALGIEPQCVEAQVGLGVLEAKAGNTKDAEELYRQAIENDPKSAAARANLGLLLASLGSEAEAEQQLTEASRAAPDDVDVLPVLASLQSKLGRLVDSTCTLHKLSELKPLSASQYIEMGIGLASLYFHQSALQEFSKAAQVDPDAPLPHVYKGRTLYDVGKISEARRQLQIGCPPDSKSAACWYLLALVERQARNIPLSIRYLHKVIGLDPQNADAEFLLGQSWFELGKTNQAVEHWQAALQASPDQWRSLHSLQRVKGAEMKKWRDQLQALEIREHVSAGVGLMSQLAQESAAARDWPSALARYQQAIRDCGGCDSAAELHLALGTTYCQVGRLADGSRELHVASQLKADDPRVTAALARIQAALQITPPHGWSELCARSIKSARLSVAAASRAIH